MNVRICVVVNLLALTVFVNCDRLTHGSTSYGRHTKNTHYNQEASEKLPSGNRQTILGTLLHPPINSECVLNVKDRFHLYSDIQQMITDDIKLIEFNLIFTGYKSGESPLVYNTSNYKPHVVYRAYDNHGKTLLSLAFNYDIMSLFTLTFGVRQMNVNVIESPMRCLQSLSSDKQLETILKLASNDFRSNTSIRVMQNRTMEHNRYGSHVCHEMIKINNGRGKFASHCCRVTYRNAQAMIWDCGNNYPSIWLRLLDHMLATIKIAILFFAPLLWRWMFHKECMLMPNYIVKLNPTQTITNILKKVTDTPIDADKQRNNGNMGNNAEMVRLERFSECLKEIQQDTPVEVKFNTLHLQIDHKKLMSEQVVPVGIFQFIHENLILCRIQKWKVFFRCCQTSIFIPGYKNIQEHRWFSLPIFKLIAKFKWKNLMDVIGILLLLVAIPSPFVVRLILYYYFENEEILSRMAVLNRLDLQPAYQYNVLHYLSPTHYTLRMMYIVYAMSFLCLTTFSMARQESVDKISLDSIQDMTDISKIKYLEFFMTQLVAPFHIFGIYGIFVGPVIWIVTLPFSIVLLVSYCIPAVYLSGRFIIHETPTFIDNILHAKKGKHETDTTGISESFEGTHPSGNGRLLHTRLNRRNHYGNKYFPLYKEGPYSCTKEMLFSKVIGVCCTLQMLCMLIMFAEVFGFLLEICVFTLMGAVVNATSAANYMILGFWVIMYSASCFNNMYQRYMKLNKEIFDAIQDNMKDAITGAILSGTANHKNIAFKYDISGSDKKKDKVGIDSEKGGYDIKQSEKCNDQSGVDEDNYHIYDEDRKQDYFDKVEYHKNRFVWKTKGLVLFLSNDNTPRIPKKLFRRVCSLKAPGCPGPVYQGMFVAIKQLLYMVLFLGFVIIVLMTFGTVYKVSSSNQVLMTLAGGFLPFIVKYILRKKEEKLTVGKFAFKGKLHNIIKGFVQAWPVYDLPFTKLVDERLADCINYADLVTPDNDDKDVSNENDINTHAVAEASLRGMGIRRKTEHTQRCRKTVSFHDDMYDVNDDDNIDYIDNTSDIIEVDCSQTHTPLVRQDAICNNSPQLIKKSSIDPSTPDGNYVLIEPEKPIKAKSRQGSFDIFIRQKSEAPYVWEQEGETLVDILISVRNDIQHVNHNQQEKTQKLRKSKQLPKTAILRKLVTRFSSETYHAMNLPVHDKKDKDKMLHLTMDMTKDALILGASFIKKTITRDAECPV